MELGGAGFYFAKIFHESLKARYENWVVGMEC